MRWKVGEFIFDEGTKQLLGRESELILEPKAASLLAYFCQNPYRNIDRQELLDSVWYGQIVSDNSINRVIVLLRKALQDENKVRRYIATIPKFGYSFIADVEALDNSNQQVERNTSVEPDRSMGKWGLLIASLMVAIGYFTLPSENSEVTQRGPAIVPLSRLAVSQSNGDLSADGNVLLYTASGDGGSAVYMMRDGLSEPVKIGPPEGYSDFAKWANRDEFLVYLHIRNGRCEFHKTEIVDDRPQPVSVIYQCPHEGYTEFNFSPDNSKLYFVERSTTFSPYVAYELDLVSLSKRRLSQPVTSGFGNHFIDVHSENGKLLLLSNKSPGKTAAYELDVEQNSFDELTDFEFSIGSAIWSHRDGHIVHPSMHPSYQLLETNVETDVSKTIVSDSRRISGARRIVNRASESGNYLFTSYVFNRDIELSDTLDAKLNSTVMDYLPSFSNDGTRIAFISKRSGYSKIWIKDFEDNTLTSIEPIDKGRLYYDLVWSEDDSKIMANTNTGIVIYSFEAQAYVEQITLPLPAFGVAWHDQSTISFSHYEDRHWHAYHRNLENGKTEILDEEWAFSLKNAQQYVRFDQQLKAYRDGEELAALSNCSLPVWRYRLRFKLEQDRIYCYAADDNQGLLSFDSEMNFTDLPGTVSRYEYFSIANGRMAKTVVDSAHSDIMRTQFSP